MQTLRSYARALIRLRTVRLKRSIPGGELHRKSVSAQEARAFAAGEQTESADIAPLVDAAADWRRRLFEASAGAGDAAGCPRLGRIADALRLDEDAQEGLALLAAIAHTPVLRETALSVTADPSVEGITPLFCAETVADRDGERARRVLRAFLPGGALADLALVESADAERPLAPRAPVQLDPALSVWIGGAAPETVWSDQTGSGELARHTPADDALPVDERAVTALRGGLVTAAGRAPRAFRLGVVGNDDLIRRHLVHTAVGRQGDALLVQRTRPLSDGPGEIRRLGRALRDARIHGAVLYLDDAERLVAEESPWWPTVEEMLTSFPGSVVLSSSEPLLALWRADDRYVQVELPLATPERQVEAMTRALGDTPQARAVAEDVAPRFSMSERVVAASAAQARALAGDGPVTSGILATAIRSQLESRIGDFASSVKAEHTLEDLELPEESARSMRELLAAYENRKRVLDEWGFGSRIANARGISALFYGPPGTGKTMAAGVLAREIGTEVYKVDLSRVVDKYIGETEKHLSRVFDEAERGQLVLLFDEADSLFGKRTEVSSATDRYANLEVNFLLQRVERHEGIVLLTTNHDNLIDPAFKRRLRYRIHFPLPEAAERAKIWERLIPADAPRDPDIEFDYLGEAWELSGGHIRNAVMRAAYLCAEAGCALNTDMLIQSANAEYRSMGKVVRDDVEDW